MAKPAAAQRLGQELKRMRPSVAVKPPQAAPSEAGAQYAKEHLKQLVARRRQATVNVTQPAAAKRDPALDLKQAQDLLRDHQYGKAEELLRAHAAAAPEDDVMRTHHLWAKIRASTEVDSKDADALKDGARKLMQNDQYDGFACYVLGHMAFIEKKDEASEKFFRRAFSKDKTNKDAERHMLILERRKQLNAKAEAEGNRKIFGITIGSGGKKDE
jgi:uncharacterized protein HemY